MAATVKIAPEVETVLRASTVDGNVLRLPAGQLDRKLYDGINKVLTALGGKWDRRSGGHIFTRGFTGDLTDILNAGAVVDQKKALEQFFTPSAIAQQMCEHMGIQDGIHVLEPSAGCGRIAEAAISYGANVTAVEIDQSLTDDLQEVAGIRMGWMRVSFADFMSWTPSDAPENPDCWYGPIDVVLMNPPFSRNQDVAHVLRAFSFLRRGGKLAAIMSNHWTFAEDRASTAFAAFLDSDAPGWTWEPLPDGSFRESGTGVNCGILYLDKPA